MIRLVHSANGPISQKPMANPPKARRPRRRRPYPPINCLTERVRFFAEVRPDLFMVVYKLVDDLFHGIPESIRLS
jgi:hypothetical protein